MEPGGDGGSSPGRGGGSGGARLEEGMKVEARYRGKSRYYPGRIRRDNHDGTWTYYPATKTGYISSSDYDELRDNLPQDEFALLKTNFIEGSYETTDDRESEMEAEWKEACDFCHSIQKASDKEYLFVATHHFEKSEVVGVAHLSLGTKSECVMESYPAQVDISRDSCIDVYRGKSEYALRRLLQTVYKFYQTWKAFEIQKDIAEQQGSLDWLSCDYELRIPSSLVNDIEYWGVRDNVDKFVQGEAWLRPTK